LVLEDARAVPLDEVRGSAALDPEVAAAVALAAANALGHAHERGVVHRALRTSAVAIAARGRVILTDFSAAEVAAAALPPIPEPIEAGESFARPDFMAPEQILGETAGPASDVWALGVLCHELLAGARPFTAEDPRAVAQRIRTGPPTPLPAAVPTTLARVVARCLAKDPQDRFPDGRAVAAALEDALAELTPLPVPVLVSRALAAAGLGEALVVRDAGPRALRAAPVTIDVARAARGLAVVLALIVAGGAGLQWLDDPDAPGPLDSQPPDPQPPGGEGVAESAPTGVESRGRGLVRVVARPWADVYVDGERVDTTPVGRPIAVLPGRHFVTFRHPQAPDEQRAIKIAAGQSVFLDVSMRVDRGDAGTGREAGAVDDSP
jgi:serine/threonine-protein kinase